MIEKQHVFVELVFRPLQPETSDKDPGTPLTVILAVPQGSPRARVSRKRKKEPASLAKHPCSEHPKVVFLPIARGTSQQSLFWKFWSLSGPQALLLFTFMIEVSMVTWWNYQWTKQNGFVCWLGHCSYSLDIDLIILRAWGYRDFREIGPSWTAFWKSGEWLQTDPLPNTPNCEIVWMTMKTLKLYVYFLRLGNGKPIFHP